MGRKRKSILATALLVTAWFAAPAAALDAKLVRDIERADEVRELAELTEDILKDQAELQPKDLAERSLIAAETTAYLLYIQAKQQQWILRKLEDLAEKPSAP